MPAQPIARLQAAWAELHGLRRQLLAMLAPWVLILGIGFTALWIELDNLQQGPLLRDRDDTLQEGSEVLLRTLDNLQRDVLLLGELASGLPHGSGTPDAATADLLQSFARSAGYYDKVRWIDERGDERLRVNTRDGRTRLVPPDDLQNKRERPFFRDASALPEGSVYFSALDLNVEQGVIERPLQPTLRAASPVYEAGTSRGIVILNYRAQRLLDRLATLGRKQGIRVYLANRDGYWIAGPSPEDNWAWQLDVDNAAGRPAPAPTLAGAQPGLWAAMRDVPQGQYDDASGSWVFRDIRPRTEALPGGPQARVSVPQPGLSLVVHLSAEAMGRGQWRWKALFATLLAAMLVIALRLAYKLTCSMAAEQARKKELQAANQALTEANDNLRSTQADLARAERLSSLGLMVAGVAHELNTPLGSATLALSTLQGQLGTLDERVRTGLRKSDLDQFLADGHAATELAQNAVRRSAGIVQRFKQVAVDRTSMERRRFDLAEIVLDADLRLRRWDPSHPVALHLALAPGVAMDSFPGPLEQVISALLDNALIHAFANRRAGTLRIEAEAPAAGEETVRIRFADDGAGIAPADLPKVFDPFFTTRRHAGGTGLGLHIVHQIVTEVLGGTVEITSSQAEGHSGTTFTLRLPLRAPERPL